jgi:hypothetical protein
MFTFVLHNVNHCLAMVKYYSINIKNIVIKLCYHFYWYICTFIRRGLLVARRWGSDIIYFISQVTKLYDDVIFCTYVDDRYFTTFFPNQAFATVSVFLQNFKEKHRDYRRSHLPFWRIENTKNVTENNGGLDEYNKWFCILTFSRQNIPHNILRHTVSHQKFLTNENIASSYNRTPNILPFSSKLHDTRTHFNV